VFHVRLPTVHSVKRKPIALTFEMLLAHEQIVLQDADLVSTALNEYRRA
jgi:hypothetical protein